MLHVGPLQVAACRVDVGGLWDWFEGSQENTALRRFGNKNSKTALLKAESQHSRLECRQTAPAMLRVNPLESQRASISYLFLVDILCAGPGTSSKNLSKTEQL